MNDIVPILDGHRYWVIIDVAICNMEYDMLGGVLRQQREHADGETDNVFDVE